MITKSQLTKLTGTYKTNESTVLREYYQLIFLNSLYGFPNSQNIVFKGGTAIHLIFGAPRYSEDLDFTVQMDLKDFELFISRVFSSLAPEGFEFKPRETIAGKRYLLANDIPESKSKLFINLDFSFRESVFECQNSNITTTLPLVFTSRISHMSQTEIYTEKIRAVLNRQKGRDLYDLWYLCAKNTKLDPVMLQSKLDYYKQIYSKNEMLKKISLFDKNEFIFDLRPFVTMGERDKMGDLFDYIQGFLKENL